MGKDRANKGTQQTRMDQYTAQSAGASLQKDPPGLGVQLQRQSYARVKRKLKDLGYTYMLLYPAKFFMRAAHISFKSPEAAWDWFERNDGTGMPESLRGESGGRLRETAEVRTAAREVPDAIVPAVKAE
ncbi:hypothetical protein NDU88_002691 [Pleurodeles waltl]|uniref:Uncharacterized protein n=1 Tax=Pleurodeles waltl TaxID=8319 RepID=A0AAV7UAH2_PLEWA|nr:hypothetical protein NDU88_002691 [Pleurodeles waltl]